MTETNLQPSAAAPSEGIYARPLVQFSLIFSAVLALAALVIGGPADGWRAAGEIVSRFSVVIFVAALAIEPLARLFPSRGLRAVAKQHEGLMFAFVAAFAVSLVCVLAPAALGAAQFTLPAIFYAGLNGAVLVVLTLSFRPVTVDKIGARSWRAMQRIATAYYWFAFTMWNFGRLGATDHPGFWYGFSFALLFGVILLRLADWFVARQRARQLAQKVA